VKKNRPQAPKKLTKNTTIVLTLCLAGPSSDMAQL